MDKVTVTIVNPFMYNGTMLKAGDEVELPRDRAVNHMRVGDVERDDALIEAVKQERKAKAEAAIADANKDW